jgi:hypothetical protein
VIAATRPTPRLRLRALVALTAVMVLGCTPRSAGEGSTDSDRRPAEIVEILIDERVEVSDGS